MKEHAASGERARKTKDLCAKRTIVGAASREPSRGNGLEKND